MSFFENTRKPVDFGGKIMIAMMNSGRGAMADWGFEHITIAEDACILEAGCGGGANTKKLLAKCPNGNVKGIDYSEVSVEKSRKVFCNNDLCMEVTHHHAKFIRHSDLVDGPYCHDEIIKMITGGFPWTTISSLVS